MVAAVLILHPLGRRPVEGSSSKRSGLKFALLTGNARALKILEGVLSYLDGKLPGLVYPCHHPGTGGCSGPEGPLSQATNCLSCVSPQYVAALEEMLLELKKHSSKPAPEVLKEYSRKVDFLKGLLEAEKLSSSSEKALANQFLAPGRTPTTAKERIPATQTVHLQTKARYAGEMRSELLDLEETSLRKRMGPLPDEKQSAADLDAILQHHHSIQEKLAEEMLHLARNLKNNTLVAQNVIKQDNQTLSHSLKLADQNFEKLKDESDRLEQHAKKSVNWLLWLMLIVVCFIFISMILFIRIFPKLR
ncbi:vesicle transport protein USE1-like [Eublepharis macularius]|uniref:Vesicle transport protein USE1 n=1 Tax=Eublepharis macularius TaxID=481883 RepID=A0AA97JFU2_EUBMA|nr:vesicle transport protein USE1-like [Eublepharis macularius]